MSEQPVEAWLAEAERMAAEERSARTSKANRTRWARMSVEERSVRAREIGAGLWSKMTAEERHAHALNLNAARTMKLAERRARGEPATKPQAASIAKKEAEAERKRLRDRHDLPVILRKILESRRANTVTIEPAIVALPSRYIPKLHRRTP